MSSERCRASISISPAIKQVDMFKREACATCPCFPERNITDKVSSVGFNHTPIEAGAIAARSVKMKLRQVCEKNISRVPEIY